MEEFEDLSMLRKAKCKKPERTVSKERVAYLWKRVRHAAKTIGRLTKMSKNISLLGSSSAIYLQKKKNSEEGYGVVTVEKKLPLFIINPKKSSFFKYWSAVMFVLLLYTLTVTPYMVCFVDNTDQYFNYFNLCVDMLFCSDIIVNLFLAYENEDGTLVTNQRQIIKKYFKFWFYIDFISSIPFEFIEQNLVKNRYNKLFRLARLPRLYRLVKVLRMNRILRVFKRYEVVKKVLYILRDHNGILNLLKFSITVTILVHIMGCLWFFMAKLNDFTPDTWVWRHGYLNSDTTTLYITSIYFVFTTLTTVGYGDIHAYTIEERAFALIIMSLGSAFYSYTISNLSTIMASIDTRTLNMKARISALNEFSKATKLPEELKQRIKSHILLNYEENIFSWFDQDALMNELPSNLRTQVSLHMYHTTVEKIYFFQDKDPGFISYMVPKLRSICLQPGDYLYREGEYPDEVYFLTKGKVNLESNNTVAFKTYVEGSYFGELEILENKVRSCSVKAHKEGAEFLVLSKQHFLKTMEEFPKIAEEIRETARLRGIKNEEAKEAARLNTHKFISEQKSRQSRTSLGSSELLEEPSSSRIERMKSKSKASIKEKNRLMWKTINEKAKEKDTEKDINESNTISKSDSKWNVIFASFFGKKHNLETPGNQSSDKPTLDQYDKKGLLKKVTIRHRERKNAKQASKWNIARAKIKQIVEMGKAEHEERELGEQREKLDWLLDDANVDSPLPSEEKDRSDPKLLILRTLYEHLKQHNWKMQHKIRMAKEAFGLLKARQSYITLQIDGMCQSILEKGEF